MRTEDYPYAIDRGQGHAKSVDTHFGSPAEYQRAMAPNMSLGAFRLHIEEKKRCRFMKN